MSMALKLAGGVLTVGASGLLGLAVAESYRARERELAAWITALASLQTEISFGYTRLGQAMRRAGMASGGLPEQVLAQAAELLERGESGGAGACLAAALGGLRQGQGQGDEVRALLALGQRLGTSDAADQARHIGLAIGRLERCRAQASEAASRNCRIWSWIGFLLGGMITITLL